MLAAPSLTASKGAKAMSERTETTKVKGWFGSEFVAAAYRVIGINSAQQGKKISPEELVKTIAIMQEPVSVPYPPEWAWGKSRELCERLGILTAHNQARIADALFEAFETGWEGANDNR